MRRGIGVGHLHQQRETADDMRGFGAAIDAESVVRLDEAAAALSESLAAFAAAHEAELRADPVLRVRTKRLADAAGVDLFAPEQTPQRQSLWRRVLTGDTDGSGGTAAQRSAVELAALVVEVCLREQRRCGTMVPLRVVLDTLNRAAGDRRVGAARVTEADVEAALATLAPFGPAYELRDGFVCCGGHGTAAEIDIALALQVAQRRAASDPPAGITAADLTDAFGWSAARAEAAVKAAVVMASAWVDEVDGTYWLPAAWASSDVI